MSQNALAQQIGVSRSTVCRWESGARRVDSDLLPLVSRKTGIPPWELRPDLAGVMEAAQ